MVFFLLFEENEIKKKLCESEYFFLFFILRVLFCIFKVSSRTCFLVIFFIQFIAIFAVVVVVNVCFAVSFHLWQLFSMSPPHDFLSH